MRAVETEQSRLDLLDGEAGYRTGKARREHGALAPLGTFGVRVLGVNHAIRQRERGFKTVGKPRRDPVAYDDAIHHRFDLVLGLAV